MYVKNNGNKEFRFSTGGDYEPPYKHERFQIIALREGEQATSSLARYGLGGLLDEVRIRPGKGHANYFMINTWRSRLVRIEPRTLRLTSSTFAPGTYQVTCRRVLIDDEKIRKAKKNAVTGDEFQHHPIDISDPQAREQFLSGLLKNVNDKSKKKQIKKAARLFFSFPQIQSNFEIEITPPDYMKLREIVTNPSANGFPCTFHYWDWYIGYLADAFDVGKNDSETAKQKILAEIDRRIASEKKEPANNLQQNKSPK
jgi:hypothetical protein